MFYALHLGIKITKILRKSYEYLTNILRISYEYLTNILRITYECLTNILRILLNNAGWENYITTYSQVKTRYVRSVCVDKVMFYALQLGKRVTKILRKSYKYCLAIWFEKIQYYSQVNAQWVCTSILCC